MLRRREAEGLPGLDPTVQHALHVGELDVLEDESLLAGLDAKRSLGRINAERDGLP